MTLTTPAEFRAHMRSAALNWRQARAAMLDAPDEYAAGGWRFVAGFWLRQARDWRTVSMHRVPFITIPGELPTISLCCTSRFS